MLRTNAVNADVKVNAQNGNKARENDGGFSDILGNVSSDGSRRQQGLSGSSDRNFGKEFGYTKKASESVRAADTGATANAGEDFAPQEMQGFDTAAADRLLEQAAETVTRTVAETGEAPTKEEAAEMMAEALRSISPQKKRLALSGSESGIVSEETDIPAMPADDLAEVLADVIAAMSGNENAAEQGLSFGTDIADAGDGEASVHVITPDSSFLMTEKHVEAAMISESRNAQPEMTEYGGFAEMLGTEDDGAYDFGRYDPYSGYDDETLDDFGLRFTENAREMFAGRTEFDDRVFTDGKGLIEKVLAKLGDESTESGEMIAEMPAVKDAAEMLSEIIGEAKRKLGLTEVKYEHTTGESDAAVPLMQNEHVKLSHEMKSSDRTDELDHILNAGEEASEIGTAEEIRHTGRTDAAGTARDGERNDGSSGRFDAAKDGDSPKTETYDAVRMSSQLMGGRTETDIPIERFELTGETAQIRPPEIQTAEEILERIQNMQDDHTEFTMVLNPESLGRITVKLVMTGERTAVEITAENPETRAILAARSENLQTMLRNNGVELERYQVVSEQENSQFREQSYEGSSKNPYSRNENGNEEDNGDDDDTPNFYDILGNL